MVWWTRFSLPGMRSPVEVIKIMAGLLISYERDGSKNAG